MTVFQPTWRSNLSAALAAARVRLINASRYPGQLALDIFIPIVFAAIPMLIGQAAAGDAAAANFQANTGTANYVAYLLVGANVFSIVSSAFWVIANWMRFEQETGTLEALFVTPTASLVIAGGVAIYAAVRSVFAALAAYLLGCWVFGVNPLAGDVFLAFAFILVGLIPLYSVALLFGALILRVKEANALINLMQWGVSFLMGIFYPVAVLPPLAQAAALLFPPTWMTNGVRSALLGVGFFFETWYFDMAVLWGFLLVMPWLGSFVFRFVEGQVRRNQGLGQF